jgi:phosphopentomutase
MSEYGLMETSDSFAAIGATIADNFELEMPKNTIGKSVLEKLV